MMMLSAVILGVLVAGCSCTVHDYSNVDDSPLCHALNYCRKGSMYFALKQQGYTAFQRKEIVREAMYMNRRCSCHPTCSFFGTCCQDATNSMFANVNADSYSRCLGLVGGSGAKIVDRCPDTTDDAALEKMCEGSDQLHRRAQTYPIQVRDGVLPYVTSVRSEITYKNKYCALCALEEESNLEEWGLRNNPFCKSTASTQCRLLQIPPQGGLRYGEYYLSAGFYREYPYLFAEENDTSVCDIEVLKDCPLDADQELDRLCRVTPMSIVQDASTMKVYFNRYCARCNEVGHLKSCEDYSTMYNYTSTTTFSSTDSADDMATSSTSSSTSSSTTTEWAVTGTSTSSTSSTSTSTTTSSSTSSSSSSSSTSTTSTPLTDTSTVYFASSTWGEAMSSSSTSTSTTASLDGSELNSGSFPDGTVIRFNTENGTRGWHVVNGGNGGEAEAQNQSNSGWFPHGTVLRQDPDNPRGLVVEPRPDQEGYPHGTVLDLDSSGTANSRGHIISLDSTTGSSALPDDGELASNAISSGANNPQSNRLRNRLANSNAIVH